MSLKQKCTIFRLRASSSSHLNFFYCQIIYRMISKELNTIDEKKYEDKWVQTEPSTVYSRGQTRSSTSKDRIDIGRKDDSWPKNPFRFSPRFDDAGQKVCDEDSYPLWLQNWGTKEGPTSQRKPILAHVISPPSGEKNRSAKRMEENEISPIFASSPSLRDTLEKEFQEEMQGLLTPEKLYYDENIDYREREVKDTTSPRGSHEESPVKGIITPKTISKRVPLKGDTPMPGSARLQRSVSRVKSYKEPSLNAKVRKGFKFFIYEDTPTEL